MFYVIYRSENIKRFHVKVGLSLSEKFAFIYFNESPLKMMKNAFYCMLKVLFVLDIFTFLSWYFGYIEKGLHEKAIVSFKLYGVTEWITIHMLFSTCIKHLQITNLLQLKYNQTALIKTF